MHFLSLLFFWLVAPAFSGNNCGDPPALNLEIVEFVKSNIGKKVDRGECWDLAAQALKTTGAAWDGDYGFGAPLKSPLTDCVYPGDIIQFEGVKLEYRSGNTLFREEMKRHTAILYEVKGKGNFLIAQQNTGQHGRRVSIDPLDLSSIKKGKITIYRPSR